MTTPNYPRDLLQKTEIPEQKYKSWEVKKFTIDEEKARYFNLQCAFNGHGRYVKAGTYTKLGKINEGRSDILWMSDTPAEINDHYYAAMNAKGHCLIAGLGLGIIVEACLRHTEVTKVTVLEIEQDVIDLVGGYLHEKWGKEKLEFIQTDALQWKPPKDAHYGMAWFDIWPVIDCGNWEEYKLLHRRYGRKADWKGSWGRDDILRMKREERYWRW